MRRFAPILALSLALLAPVAQAEDVLLGTITSSGSSTTNADTATPFAISASGVELVRLAVQCDAAAYVELGGSSVEVSSSDGQKVPADAFFSLGKVFSGRNTLAVISVSGTVNCKVFQVKDTLPVRD